MPERDPPVGPKLARLVGLAVDSTPGVGPAPPPRYDDTALGPPASRESPIEPDATPATDAFTSSGLVSSDAEAGGHAGDGRGESPTDRSNRSGSGAAGAAEPPGAMASGEATSSTPAPGLTGPATEGDEGHPDSTASMRSQPRRRHMVWVAPPPASPPPSPAAGRTEPAATTDPVTPDDPTGGLRPSAATTEADQMVDPPDGMVGAAEPAPGRSTSPAVPGDGPTTAEPAAPLVAPDLSSADGTGHPTGAATGTGDPTGTPTGDLTGGATGAEPGGTGARGEQTLSDRPSPTDAPATAARPAPAIPPDPTTTPSMVQPAAEPVSPAPVIRPTEPARPEPVRIEIGSIDIIVSPPPTPSPAPRRVARRPPRAHSIPLAGLEEG